MVPRSAASESPRMATSSRVRKYRLRAVVAGVVFCTPSRPKGSPYPLDFIVMKAQACTVRQRRKIADGHDGEGRDRARVGVSIEPGPDDRGIEIDGSV